jgi:hypothetical protein
MAKPKSSGKNGAAKPRSRKKAAAKSDAAAETAAKVDLPKSSVVTKLLKDLRSNKSDLVDVGTSKRSLLKGGEDAGVHKKAILQIHSLERLSPEALHDWAGHFFAYWTISGLEKKAASAPNFETIEERDDAERQAREDGEQAPPGAGFSEPVVTH